MKYRWVGTAALFCTRFLCDMRGFASSGVAALMHCFGWATGRNLEKGVRTGFAHVYYTFFIVLQFVEIGIVTSIEINHKPVEVAKKGQEVCVKIEPIPGESPKMYGRHFEATDILVSKVKAICIFGLWRNGNLLEVEMLRKAWKINISNLASETETLEIIHVWHCSTAFLCSLVLRSVVVLLERTEGTMYCN